MEIFFYLSLLLTLLGGTLAATAIDNYSHPKHPGKCYIDKDRILKPGRHFNVFGCDEVHCSKRGWVNISTCGVSILQRPGCHMEKSKATTYPECCTPVLVCPDDD